MKYVRLRYFSRSRIELKIFPDKTIRLINTSKVLEFKGRIIGYEKLPMIRSQNLFFLLKLNNIICYNFSSKEMFKIKKGRVKNYRAKAN